MQKESVVTKFLAVFQAVLVISIVFSFSAIMNSSFVDAQEKVDFSSYSNLNPYEEKPSLVNPGSTDSATRINSADAKTGSDGGAGKGIGGIVSGILKGTVTGTAWDPLIAGAAWGGIIAGGVQLVGNLIGADQKVVNALSAAAFFGSVAGGGVASLVKAGVFKAPFGIGGTGLGIATGIGVAAVVFVLLYKQEETKYVQFQCLPFEAPLGGNSCEECNNDPLHPCSEYRCKALGQACGIVNEGTSEEKCVWISPDDVTSPIIQAREEVLTEGHSYRPDNAIRPPNRGVKINYDSSSNGCIKPFTPLEFGVTTNEPAQCKIDYIRTDKLEDMQFFFGENSLYQTNHTQTLRLPSPDSLNSEAPELQNDGIYSWYVRCRDANGNENVDEFVFNFCVDPSPDTTAPVIEESSIRSGSPVSYQTQSLNFSVYVNEPAECKWSTQDKDYDSMENAMACSTRVYQQNSQQLYPCSTTLSGIQDRQTNDFYFRCKDQPNKPENERNVNSESYKVTLLGSQELNIIDFAPNETITGSTDVVKVDLQVETSNGANEGRSTCYFSNTGEEGSFIAMFETDDAYHKQELNLPSGDYEYYFRCIDAGGNTDEAKTVFNVFTDRQAPRITRAYKEGADALKIVTNEDAKCSYSINNCNFNIDEGLAFIYTDQDNLMEHFAKWDTSSSYYIRCRDEFGNEPSTNSCNLIATATNIL